MEEKIVSCKEIFVYDTTLPQPTKHSDNFFLTPPLYGVIYDAKFYGDARFLKCQKTRTGI